ncbi:phage tail protein [Pseudomonas sp. 5P_3.1_Bac2]|uniref:phage tail protein n=1 Tax=Pseudomonas sp. 5P_3.1_Bac2 TaxID=2971617 RepID=UPI0021C8B349|nr:phage tail protein [Pseudomonas sp. 5P_3.1_Bac2]MCU1717431.1 phage tail protein [Pseudomonas sp. 5P_3.1_Bac2]
MSDNYFIHRQNLNFYCSAVHGDDLPPADQLQALSAEQYQLFSQVAGAAVAGKTLGQDADGNVQVIDRPAPSADELRLRLERLIDYAADKLRRQLTGDPLRAVEYEQARVEAEQFVAAAYQGDVPSMVAAWAIAPRTAQEAADEILRKAANYRSVFEQLRTLRLAAKEQIRQYIKEAQLDQAQAFTDEAVKNLEQLPTQLDLDF